MFLLKTITNFLQILNRLADLINMYVLTNMSNCCKTYLNSKKYLFFLEIKWS